MEDPPRHLTDQELSCVDRYLAILANVLGPRLVEVWLFGSAARGDMWSAMPIRSDIDLLVLSSEPVPAEVQEDLINETLPLFLESGRQIAPQFRTIDWFRQPYDRHRDFIARVREDGSVLYHAE